MRAAEAMRALRAASDPRIAEIYRRRQTAVDTIGVRFADLEAIAKRAGRDHALGEALWATGILDARFLATKVMDPLALAEADGTRMVTEVDYPVLADMFAALVYPARFSPKLARRWAKSRKEFVRRTGYALLNDFAAAPDSPFTPEELAGCLETIGATIHTSPNWAREMMNMVPITIGKAHPELAALALATAERYGKIDVFHGDQTHCKVWDAAEALRDPRVKIKRPRPRPPTGTATRAPRP